MKPFDSSPSRLEAAPTDGEFENQDSAVVETSNAAPKAIWFSALWIFLGCVDLLFFSWDRHSGIPEAVERYLFHLRFGFIPAGILILYLPYFLSVYLALKKKIDLRLVLAVGILFRLILLPSLPILETDLYRYLWDGHMINTGNNPYRYAPQEIENAINPPPLGSETTDDLKTIADENRDNPLHREILANINNKSVPTIYFPVAQYLFAVGDGLVSTLLPTQAIEGEETDWERMAEVATMIWKVVLLPFEIGILFLTVSLLRKVGLNPSWVLIYAWSPLVLKEYANTGHYDPVVVFLTLLGLRLALEIKEGLKFRVLSGAVLGAAIGCKAFPLLFLPFLWKKLRTWGMAAAGIILLLLYIPFLGVGSRMFTGLATYSDRWEFNSGLVAFNEWWISALQSLWVSAPVTESVRGDGVPNALFTFAGVEFTLDAFFMAKAISGLLILGMLGYLTWVSLKESEERGASPIVPVRRVYLMIGTLLLASPVTDPWYLCWIVPFLCLFPNKAWLYFTFSAQVYYLYFWNDWSYVTFSDLSWLGVDSSWEIARMVEYIPFFLLLVWGWWHSRKNSETIPRL
ncbi:MAG: hypothetical protein H6751_02615 [Candidatus Omnitrophica bacterium]|nr:hypothetical protein [Candidatus Omnitrophota bacterium]